MTTLASAAAEAASVTRSPASRARAGRCRVGPQPDDDVEPRLVEVARMRLALAAVADDRDALALQSGRDRCRRRR